MDIHIYARSLKRERELRPGFDSRIPISLSNPKKSGRAEWINENESTVNKTMNDPYKSSIR
jgi:hypothetical protein